MFFHFRHGKGFRSSFGSGLVPGFASGALGCSNYASYRYPFHFCQMLRSFMVAGYLLSRLHIVSIAQRIRHSAGRPVAPGAMKGRACCAATHGAARPRQISNAGCWIARANENANAQGQSRLESDIHAFKRGRGQVHRMPPTGMQTPGTAAGTARKGHPHRGVGHLVHIFGPRLV